MLLFLSTWFIPSYFDGLAMPSHQLVRWRQSNFICPRTPTAFSHNVSKHRKFLHGSTLGTQIRAAIPVSILSTSAFGTERPAPHVNLVVCTIHYPKNKCWNSLPIQCFRLDLSDIAILPNCTPFFGRESWSRFIWRESFPLVGMSCLELDRYFPARALLQEKL